MKPAFPRRLNCHVKESARVVSLKIICYCYLLTASEIASDDSLTITLKTDAPLANADGETQLVGVSSAISGNCKNATKEISITFDEQMLKAFKIPADWYISFENEKKVFKALTVHKRSRKNEQIPRISFQ